MANVHIVGAGISGLACAVRLAETPHRITLYDGAGHAGGRCRSFFEERLGCTIDNGNHLLLSGNTAVLEYLERIGAGGELIGPSEAVFPFADVENGRTWTVKMGGGPLPLWLLRAENRIPGVRLRDYFDAVKLLWAGPDAALGQVVRPESALFRSFWDPLAVGVLNTPAAEGAAKLLAAVFRETFLRGRAHCMPRMARLGLSETFVNPALAYLKARGNKFQPNRRLRHIELDENRVRKLSFSDGDVTVDGDDSVVLAVTAHGAKALLPELTAPTETHPIVNVHFRLPQAISPPHGAGLIGIVGGTAHWIFFRNDVLSVTVSAADELARQDADRIVAAVWRDICAAVPGIDPALPERHLVVKERRATFSQTPASIRRRPRARCGYTNLYLAGDWTDTGLPATIEGSIRSGNTAASAVLQG